MFPNSNDDALIAQVYTASEFLSRATIDAFLYFLPIIKDSMPLPHPISIILFTGLVLLLRY